MRIMGRTGMAVALTGMLAVCVANPAFAARKKTTTGAKRIRSQIKALNSTGAAVIIIKRRRPRPPPMPPRRQIERFGV
jgi:hypothetical protein